MEFFVRLVEISGDSVASEKICFYSRKITIFIGKLLLVLFNQLLRWQILLVIWSVTVKIVYDKKHFHYRYLACTSLVAQKRLS